MGMDPSTARLLTFIGTIIGASVIFSVGYVVYCIVEAMIAEYKVHKRLRWKEALQRAASERLGNTPIGINATPDYGSMQTA